jgi:PAS domain S-box-containing protein
VNSAVEKITGYTPEDHYKDPYLGFKLVHPDDVPILQDVIKKPSSEPLILRWIKKDGTIIWTEQINKIIYNLQKEAIAIIGTARDITAKKKAEDEIKRLQKFLPICAKCKQIRDDKGYWSQVEKYISNHSTTQFTHTLCPKCEKDALNELK